MNYNFIKNNYFEIFISITVTIAGIYRLFCPDIRQKEIDNMKIINMNHEFLIMLFEISAIYFIFFTTPFIKKLYIGTYLFFCSIVTLLYIYNKNIIKLVKNLIIYTNNAESIGIHFIILVIMFYLFIK